MRRYRGSGSYGRGRKALYAPPLTVELSREQLKETLKRFVQNFPPSSHLKIKELTGASFVMCRATETQPITPVLFIGYPYKMGKIPVLSKHSLKYYRENLNHPFIDTLIEVLIELFPYLAEQDNPASLIEKHKVIVARGITTDIISQVPEDWVEPKIEVAIAKEEKGKL